MTDFVGYLVAALLVVVLTEAVRPLRGRWPTWLATLVDRLCHRFRVRISVVEDPTDGEIVVNVRNQSRARLEIQDVRLMLTPNYGIALGPLDSPLPGDVDPNAELGWGYDSGDLRGLLERISFSDTTWRLTPCVKDSKGREYWGKADIVIQRDGAVSYAPTRFNVRVVLAFSVVMPVVWLGIAASILVYLLAQASTGSP